MRLSGSEGKKRESRTRKGQSFEDIADKAYDSDTFRATLKGKRCIPVIPYKSNRKVPQEYDKHTYKERHAIECFFSKIKYFRRVFSRFDKSARNFIAFLSFVGAILWLR